MKSSKPLWRISVVTTAEAEDAATELLSTVLSVPAAAYFDLESQTSTVSAFVEQGRFSPAKTRTEISAGLARMNGFGLDTGVAKTEIARVKREDWAESWKRHFKPVEFKIRPGASSKFKSLLVKPSWIRGPAARHQAVVVLDPGLSFGTGQHPTTSFCLDALVRCLKTWKSQSFLDIGTGSGILAIAAAKLGYRPVHAFDYDPQAVRVTAHNARKNRVSDRIVLTRSDIAKLPLHPARQYDLVCANLISPLLISERRRIVNRLRKGGTLVLAGILETEFTEVGRAFADLKLRPGPSRAENEWRSGVFYFE
jgi:ribosomal protein L11 methyltransferase